MNDDISWDKICITRNNVSLYEMNFVFSQKIISWYSMNQRNLLHLQDIHFCHQGQYSKSVIKTYPNIQKTQLIQIDTHRKYRVAQSTWGSLQMIPLIGRLSDIVIYVPRENNRSPEIWSKEGERLLYPVVASSTIRDSISMN